MRSTRALVVVAGVAYTAALLLVAAWPTPVDASVDVEGSWPVAVVAWLPGGSTLLGYRVVEAAANVALFVPMGALGVWVLPRWPWWRVALAGAAVSAAVEVGQALLRPDRFATWTDVAANSVGAFVGAFVVSWVRRRAVARRKHPRR